VADSRANDLRFKSRRRTGLQKRLEESLVPIVYVPPQLKMLTGGAETVAVDCRNVRGAIAKLDEQFPGVKERLCQGDELRPGVSVSVNGRISSLGLYQKVQPQDEVHFIPAIGGG
jgi:molybdopterin synthase sulfur carrier subunit